MTRQGVIPVIAMFTGACILSACSSTPKVSTEVHRPAAGPQASAASAPTSTSTSTPSPSAPGVTAGGHGTPPSKSGGSATKATTTTPSASSSSSPGPPPNVVGQSLAAAEQKLASAGYGTAAHPWGGSCRTPNAIMQQVPPAQGNIQLYYCANPS